MSSVADLANYNYVPNAPRQPWGAATSAVGGTQYLNVPEFIKSYMSGTPAITPSMSPTQIAQNQFSNAVGTRYQTQPAPLPPGAQVYPQQSSGGYGKGGNPVPGGPFPAPQRDPNDYRVYQSPGNPAIWQGMVPANIPPVMKTISGPVQPATTTPTTPTTPNVNPRDDAYYDIQF
jgi:hypothetical protein